MYFLGTAKMDSSNRLTLIKDVVDILQVKEKTHVAFYIDDGDIIIRKITQVKTASYKEEAVEEWARKKKAEIELMKTSGEYDDDYLSNLGLDIDVKLSAAKEIKEMAKKSNLN